VALSHEEGSFILPQEHGRAVHGQGAQTEWRAKIESMETDLRPPVLLVATPQVLDPFFHRSVVLLIHHDEEGSLGFIVNRPTGIRIAEILKGMEISWLGDREAMAYFGGPVQPQLGTVLFTRSPDGTVEETPSEVLPGLAITQQIGDLEQLAAVPPEDLHLYLGYAGWGSGQLVEEILRNDWITAPVSQQLIFAPQPEEVWKQALQTVGVDPAALPSWSSPVGGETAN
jgi:putative transcriptional regulator